MKAFMLVAVFASAGILAVTTSAQAQTASFEDSRDQGILYFKKGIYKQAKVRLDKAFKKKSGKADFLTVYYRGQTYYKMLLLETAFEMAEQAAALSEKDERRSRKAKKFLGEMQALYGKVTFKAAKGETNKKGRIFFEAKTGIINKKKKKRFLAIRERFRSTDVRLPTTVYLPYGDYLANKVPFTLTAEGKAPVVEIYLQVVVAPTEGTSMWWWVGAGGAAVAAAGATFFLLQGDEPPPSEVVRFGIDNGL